MSWTVHEPRTSAAIAIASMLAITATPARAQTSGEYARLKAEVETLRAAQAASAARLAKLEAMLATVSPSVLQPATAVATGTSAPPGSATPTTAPTQVAAQERRVDPSPAAPVNPAGGSSPGRVPAGPAKLTLNGDLRVRYEANFGDADARNRDRGVMRGRLRALYAINKLVSIGGELSTGDAGDPNSTDITLNGFDNDLDVSLSQAYIRLTSKDLTVFAGKIPQPFVRTELEWDGDINPEGVSASYRFNLGAGTTVKANGLYFLVDEAPAARDSSMIGGQLQLETPVSPQVKLELAAGYYDYRLGTTAGGDAGDFRTNRFLNGRYLSDFNLLDIVGAVQYNGLGERWPLRAVGDYVHNFGATAGDKSGFGIDLLAGRASKRGDWRFGYGYAEVGVDAVLAAFSHDNTNIATNYVQHTAVVDYTPLDNIVLNVTYYRYKPKQALFAGGNAVDDWLNRLRLNMLVNF